MSGPVLPFWELKLARPVVLKSGDWEKPSFKNGAFTSGKPFRDIRRTPPESGREA
jgi:hypothetical protein